MSGQPSEVKELIADKLDISDSEQSEQISSGGSWFSKNVDWARFYLAKADYIDASTREVWSLTEKGRSVRLTNDEALHLFQNIHQEFSVLRRKQNGKAAKVAETKVDIPDDLPAEENNHRAILLRKLIDLPENGFERLCQRLLRASGFESVTITGKSGDGGLEKDYPGAIG